MYSSLRLSDTRNSDKNGTDAKTYNNSSLLFSNGGSIYSEDKEHITQACTYVYVRVYVCMHVPMYICSKYACTNLCMYAYHL